MLKQAEFSTSFGVMAHTRQCALRYEVPGIWIVLLIDGYMAYEEGERRYIYSTSAFAQHNP
jgi:hypothetical protein